MPITGRGDSYAPANTAEKTFGVHPETQQGRKRLNLVTHFTLGTLWGAAYGVAAHAGLLGPKARRPSPPSTPATSSPTPRAVSMSHRRGQRRTGPST